MKQALILLFTGVALYSCSPKTQVAVVTPEPTATPPVVAALQSQLDSASYAFGASIATDLKTRGVNALNGELLARGFNDVFSGGSQLLTAEKSQEVIYSFLTMIDSKRFENAKAESAGFLEKNKSKPGVVTLPSGLQYEILTPGTGPKPKPTDEVTVHYKGSLVDGKQFDSSYDRGEPTTFMLNQVIPGWTEGLQQMPQGSKYRFYIPYSLGYGERGAGKDIPPFSTLIFEVELLKINGK